MIVHPRTLESLRPLGVSESLLDRGDRAPRAQLHLGTRQVSAQLAEVALSDTAYPHLTLLRQMDVEEVLADALVRRGVAVERGVELIDAAAADGRTRAILRADGARSGGDSPLHRRLRRPVEHGTRDREDRLARWNVPRGGGSRRRRVRRGPPAGRPPRHRRSPRAVSSSSRWARARPGASSRRGPVAGMTCPSASPVPRCPLHSCASSSTRRGSGSPWAT